MRWHAARGVSPSVALPVNRLILKGEWCSPLAAYDPIEVPWVSKHAFGRRSWP